MTDSGSSPPEHEVEPTSAREEQDTTALEGRSAPPQDQEMVSADGLGRTSSFENMGLIASVIMLASLVMVMWNLQTGSRKNANTGSRYATVQALVDYGTYAINKTQYAFTIDKVKVGKDFVSSKPPVLPTYAAGVYWVYQKLTGNKIRTHEGDVVWLVSLFTGWLAHLIFLIYFYRFCKLLIQRQLAIIVGLLAAAFAYLGVAYATHINNHSIGAAMGLVGFYYSFRLRNGLNAKLRHWIIAGLCLGFLPTVDLPSLSITVFCGIYLASRDWKRTALLFVPALLPGIACGLVLSQLSTGSLIPAYANPELKDFPENYFRHRRAGIDALQEPKHIYGFHVLLGHHGLFSMTPLFVFSLISLIRDLRPKGKYFAEALLVAATTLVVVAFYILRTHNYGGWCVGMRWLVPVMAFLLLYFVRWLDQARIQRWSWGLVLAAFSVSAFHVQDGLTSPFQFSRWHNWIDGKPNRGRVGPELNLPKKKKQRKPRRTRKTSRKK